MAGKKKKSEPKINRGGSSTVIYFSLGAAATAGLAALVTLLLRRRNPTGEISNPGTGPARPAEPQPAPHVLDAGPRPPDSAGPRPQTIRSASTGAAVTPDPVPEAGAPGADTTWSQTTKYLVGVGLFISVLFAIYISRGSLKMIALAALIAFVVRPIIAGLTRRFKLKTGCATGIVYLVVILLLILIPILVIPALVQAVNAISVGIFQHAAGNLAASIDALIQNLSSFPALSGALTPLLESLSSALAQIAAGGAPPPLEVTASEAALTGSLGLTLKGLADVLGPLISSIVAFVFALLISIQMSIAGDLFRNSGLNMVPAAYKPEVTALMDKLGKIWNSFMRGELTLMFVVGTSVWIGNWLIGTPYAFALGVLAGLLEVIPSLGPLLAWIPAVFVALVFGSTRFTGMDPLVFALLVSLLYGLIQALENQVLVPQILGDAVHLPPVVVLIGVVIFGDLFGILGILIATPTLATLAEIYNYLYGKILEGPATPPDEGKRSLMDRVRNFAGRIRLPWRRERKKETVSVESPAVPAE